MTTLTNAARDHALAAARDGKHVLIVLPSRADAHAAYHRIMARNHGTVLAGATGAVRVASVETITTGALRGLSVDLVVVGLGVSADGPLAEEFQRHVRHTHGEILEEAFL